MRLPHKSVKGDPFMKSIMQDTRECYFCHREHGLELHHCMMGKWRKLADQDGLTVWLCHDHHTGNNGVHFNLDMRLELQKLAEKTYIEHHSFDEWMRRYGKNYLEEKDVSD